MKVLEEFFLERVKVAQHAISVFLRMSFLKENRALQNLKILSLDRV